jgi:hypothetical protein
MMIWQIWFVFEHLGIYTSVGKYVSAHAELHTAVTGLVFIGQAAGVVERSKML